MSRIFIEIAIVTFNCPNCGNEYNDDDDKYLDRCNRNKSLTTTIKCDRCEERFGMTYDMMGNAQSFEIRER